MQSWVHELSDNAFTKLNDNEEKEDCIDSIFDVRLVRTGRDFLRHTVLCNAQPSC